MLLRFFINSKIDNPTEVEAERFYIHTKDNSLKRTIVNTLGEGSMDIYVGESAAISMDFIKDRAYVNLIIDYYD